MPLLLLPLLLLPLLLLLLKVVRVFWLCDRCCLCHRRVPLLQRL